MQNKYFELTERASDKGHIFFTWLYTLIKKPIIWCLELFMMIILYVTFFVLGMFVNEKTKYID